MNGAGKLAMFATAWARGGSGGGSCLVGLTCPSMVMKNVLELDRVGCTT